MKVVVVSSNGQRSMRTVVVQTNLKKLETLQYLLFNPREIMNLNLKKMTLTSPLKSITQQT